MVRISLTADAPLPWIHIPLPDTYRRALDIYATLISDGTMDVPSAMGNLTKDLMAAYGPRNPRLNTIRRLYLYR